MQSKNTSYAFIFIAWFAGIYHTALGLVGTFGNSHLVMSLANKVYGININMDPDLFISFARFAGSYMIAFGLMMILLAIKPREYRNIAWVGVALIMIRIFDRIVFSGVLYKAFGVTLMSSVPTLLIIGFMALGLILFIPKK